MRQVRRIAVNALKEDIGDGDITTDSTIRVGAGLTGRFVAKEDGIVAGLEVVREVLRLRDRRCHISELIHDGAAVTRGQLIATVVGKGRAILSCERVALNILQRMSGIATLTRAFVNAVSGTKAVVVDTRKTAPGLRILDKWSVRLGGGQNHRFGLYDRVLVKENHIAAAGGIANAVTLIRKTDKRKRPIEVEVRNLKELREVLELNVEQILLDNMSLAELAEAVDVTKGRSLLEASGNVTLESVGRIARTGVDIISVGMLTHSVRALDVSFLIEP